MNSEGITGKTITSERPLILIRITTENFVEMRKIGKLFIIMFVLGLTTVSCTDTYAEDQSIYENATEGDDQNNPDERNTGNN